MDPAVHCRIVIAENRRCDGNTDIYHRYEHIDVRSADLGTDRQSRLQGNGMEAKV